MRLLVALLVGAVVAVACGSGGEEAAGTESSERAPREASVVQEEAQAQPRPEAVAEAQAVQEAEQDQADGQAVGPEQQAEEELATAMPTGVAGAVGVHKGVRSQGRSLGLVEAPVLIEHFGDFT